jgi:uncharacterized membrane protein YebE (DUF533 family)
VIDANKLMDQLMSSGVGGGLAGGLLSGALAGAIAGGKGKKLGKTALKLGGTALVAGLAYKAWQQYQAGKPSPGAGSADTLFGSVPAAAPGAAPVPAVGQGDALAIVRAMIAAAKADGQVDAAEHQHIFGQINRLSLNAEEKSFLLEEFSRPLDLEAVVRSANTSELALELYAASRLVIAEASPAESAYLQLLAARLGLQPALVHEVDNAAHGLRAA